MTELFLFLNQFGDISRPGEYDKCLTERWSFRTSSESMLCVTHVTDREAYWMWMLREKEDRSPTAASTEHFLPALTTILFIY